MGPELTKSRQQGEAGMAASLAAGTRATHDTGYGHAALPSLMMDRWQLFPTFLIRPRRIPICSLMSIWTLQHPSRSLTANA